MDEFLHEAVRLRAQFRCEYCHFPEKFAEVPFHVDHVIAQPHGGATALPNLAFACCFCNRHKGPNLSGIDPTTSTVTELFRPRQQLWREHFQWNGATLVGRTPNGRATIQVLNINRADSVAVRRLLMQEGVYPSDGAP